MANDVSQADAVFGTLTNRVKIFDRDGENRAYPLMSKEKLDELIAATKLGELISKKEDEDKKCCKKCSTIIIAVLAIVGAVAAVAGIAYAVYRYFTPDYLDDFDDEDFEDEDFDDDFEDEDIEK